MSKFKPAPKPKTVEDFIGGAPSVAPLSVNDEKQYFRVNIQITQKQHDVLRKISFERRVSQAELVREALDNWLQSQLPVPK